VQPRARARLGLPAKVVSCLASVKWDWSSSSGRYSAAAVGGRVLRILLALALSALSFAPMISDSATAVPADF
jgi:hypothetical protein